MTRTDSSAPTGALHELYGHSLALLTDLYQLTMAYGYWKNGVSEREAVFHLFYRRNPFKGGYAVACGLDTAVQLLESYRFDDGDLDFLATVTGNDGKPLFERGFLDYLRQLEFRCDMDAVPEGTVVFPHEPIIRMRGPILQCQLLETPLLNIVNFQTLVATKSARVCMAARGEPVLEFGLRRAQGIDGALAASRAAYVGGAAATSNVLAGKLFDIPVKGTHAHSWVMFHDSERDSFERYAEAMPNNCVFLVDTYDTLEGVRHAVEVGKVLRQRGHELAGIRLDSGDLAHLSVEARKLMDEAGFPSAAIVASNDLDEHLIESLKLQGATIGVWGVGTKLATAFDQPALGGVYKLSAVRGDDGAWNHKIKLSEQAIKISNPGVQQIRRYSRDGEFLADMIYDEELGTDGGQADAMFDLEDLTRKRPLPDATATEDLLRPVFRAGARIYESVPLARVRAFAASQLEQLNPRVKRFANPQFYDVGLAPSLHRLKMQLIAAARGDEL